MRYRQGDDQQLGTVMIGTFRTVADLATIPGMDRSRLDRVETFLTVTSNAFRFIATGACGVARARPVRINAWRCSNARPGHCSALLAAIRLGPLEKYRCNLTRRNRW